MLLNYNLFGSVFKTGYHTTYDNGFSTPLLFGIYENLLNPHKSFFVFAPPALLACFGLKAFLKKQKTLGTIAIAVFFSYLLLYSKWWAASGGLCLGPRFLLPTVPLMMMPLAELFAPANISHKRWLRIIIPVAILGMLLQLVWMSIDYTSVSQLLHGNFLQIFNYVEILYKTGPRALDFWYINMLGEIPLVWYLLAITPPLVCFVSGIILMRSQRFQP